MRITNIKKNSKKINTYDFEVKNKHHYIMDNGCVSHNTSSALVQGVTASYLPAHAKDSTQKLGDMIVPILPKFIGKKFWSYKTKFQYKTEDLIRFTRRCQRWVDTGMSMECPINTELTNIKKISDEILDGFSKKELKCVYYSLTVDGKNSACTDCAN